MTNKILIIYFLLLLFISCNNDPTYQPNIDCLGIEDGNNFLDECGECVPDTSQACIQDCAGEWGGNNICDCTDSTSYNYNPNATFDDGSCDTSIILTTFIKNVSPENDCGYDIDIKQTQDGGYIIAGCNDGSAWLMKTDPYGDKDWEQTYNMGDYWGNRTVIQASDGGYLFAGWEGILKTDQNGTKEWIKKGVQGNNGQRPYYEDIIEHSNGYYYAVGGPVTPRGDTKKGGQAILVKIDQSGTVKKTKFYGGNCEDDLFRALIESNDGKLIMVGEKGHGNQSYPCSFNFRYYKDVYVVKTGLNGGVIWQKTYGGDYLEKGMDIVNTEEEGYMILGQKCAHGYDIYSCGPRTKVLILNIDESGNNLDETILPGLSFYEGGTAMSLAKTHSGGFVFNTYPRTGGSVWLYKWGNSEETINLKISPGGLGGESIERTNDNGFIISTTGNTIIKTDLHLSY
tara:strand:- start:2667 stop:4034 length:1368 start_codon:yes stop_codon:yes gene_type:complete